MHTGGKSSVLWFLAYFVILAGIGFFVRDIPGQPELFSTIDNFMGADSISGFGDPASFALGAREIYHYGWIRSESQWLIRLWPPGFMVTEGVVLKVFGPDAPFIFALILLSAAQVALLLSIMRLNFLNYIKHPVATLLPLAPFVFPVTRLFLLEPAGVIFGEGFAIAFFMIAILLAPLGFKSRSMTCGIIAGLSLAFAAYFRSQFELVVMFLTLVATMFFFIYLLYFRTRLGADEREPMIHVFKTIAVMLFVAHALMAPWRLHNLFEPFTSNLSWVQTSSLVYKNAGVPDRDLIEAGGKWIVEGGGNLACRLELDYCGKSDKTGFYRVFFSHPINWVVGKYEFFPDYWFSSLKNFAPVKYSASAVDLITNLFLLSFVLFNIALLVRIRGRLEAVYYSWAVFSFYACNLSIFLMVHFETRYFYALKISSIFFFVVLATNAWGFYGKNNSNRGNKIASSVG